MNRHQGLEQYVDELALTPIVKVRISIRKPRASWLPYLGAGLAIGLLPVALVVSCGFLVDYADLGAPWYAAMVAWGCAYVGGGLGVVATYFVMERR